LSGFDTISLDRSIQFRKAHIEPKSSFRDFGALPLRARHEVNDSAVTSPSDNQLQRSHSLAIAMEYFSTVPSRFPRARTSSK
jgi:hypothetical protein